MAEELQVSSDAEQYQEEIKSLKTHIKSLEFQIADLKTYIVNQRNMHAREMEVVKAGEKELQEKVVRLNKEAAEVRTHPVIIKRSTKEAKDQISDLLPIGVVKDLLQHAFLALENSSSSVMATLNDRVNSLSSRLRKSLIYISKSKLAAQTHRDNQELLLVSMRTTIHQKNSMLERQTKLLNQMAEDKRQSDQLYERHLTFLESSRDQKRQLFDRLERASTQLHQFTSLRDSMAMRRAVEGSICFSKDMDSKHEADNLAATQGCLPHFNGFPHRTSNPTVITPYDQNASCYHKTMIDAPLPEHTERESPTKDHRSKLKECFRRAMSNLASPDKYMGPPQKGIQVKIRPSATANTEYTGPTLKSKCLNASTIPTGLNKKKVTSKRVDLTATIYAQPSNLRSKQNVRYT